MNGLGTRKGVGRSPVVVGRGGGRAGGARSCKSARPTGVSCVGACLVGRNAIGRNSHIHHDDVTDPLPQPRLNQQRHVEHHAPLSTQPRPYYPPDDLPPDLPSALAPLREAQHIQRKDGL